MDFDQAGIFNVSYLLWQGVSVSRSRPKHRAIFRLYGK